MLLLDALRQSGNSDSALPEHRSLCQLLYHKIKSTDMSLVDFATDNKETQVLAIALDMYSPGDILASIFADTAKHSLAKVIVGYSPNYTLHLRPQTLVQILATCCICTLRGGSMYTAIRQVVGNTTRPAS